MNSSDIASAPGYFGRYWQAWTRPHPSITDIEQKRQSRLLAGFLLVLIPVLTVVTCLSVPVMLRRGRITLTIPILIVTLVLLALQYNLNRRGQYRISAWMFVGLVFAVDHLTALSSFGTLVGMFYVMLMLLISAMLLTPRATLGLFCLTLAIQLFFGIIAPKTSPVENVSVLFFTVVVSPFILIFTFHRAGIEAERRAELLAANDRLRESEALLEKRVAERTRDLEVAADVSRQVATVLDLPRLLPQLVARTQSGFKLYHVAVYLYDASSQLLRYVDGTGDAGRALKAANLPLHIHDARPVCRAARTLAPVLVPDVTQDAAYTRSDLLPLTRAELVLPMVVRDELIGVLDLQSEQFNHFTPDELRVMGVLAEQASVAVQNARLYAEQVEVAAQLREVDRMKSNFLASMSHELRTPLNAILNFTEFVTMGLLGDVNERQVDALAKVLDSSHHLLSLINDVLDMTKIEAGMMRLFVEDNINLYTELKPVTDTAQTLLKGKDVRFIEDIEPDLPLIVGDKRRIRQILLNLISNACKFTVEGSITLRVNRRDDDILFAVIDTGPGIAPADHELIFEAFRQTPTGIDQSSGTGLGLPITRRLVEAHHGRLWLESEPGKGSAFYVTLPVQSVELMQLLNEIRSDA